MSRIIAVANQKGGVGKTTTAINLGAALGLRGRRVLIVDLDPQANATSGLGVENSGLGTYELLIEGQEAAGLVRETGQPGLWIIPSRSDLAGAEVELVPMMAREFRLRRAIEGIAGQYDYVFVDCPPSLGLLTVNALAAADQVLVPVQCEYLALEGLGHLVNTVDLVRRHLNSRLRVAGLLLTMYDARTNLSQQVVDEVRKHFPSTLATVIPRNVRVSEAPSHGLPLCAYDPRSAAARAYDQLAAELLEREEVAA